MKLITLTQNQFAQVDDEDYEYLNQFKWHAVKKGNGSFYANRSVGPAGKQKRIQMHNVVFKKINQNSLPDHIDGNGLNNQKNNLREATHSQNQANRRVSKSKVSSKYLGVYWNKVNQNWYAQILKKHLGVFNNEIDAALAYNNAARIHHGEFAKLNTL